MSVPTSVTPFDLSRTFTLDAAGKDQPVDREKLVKMAQEFEGMLLLQMVRQMRQAMLEDEEEDTGLGNTTMTDTFDVEFANYLAKQGGIGLSKAIEQQIEKANKAKEAAAALKGVETEQKPLEASPKAIGLEPPSPLPLSPGRGVSILAPGAMPQTPDTQRLREGARRQADGVTASGAMASEATPADGVEGHASALHSEIPPFLGEGGQGGEGLTLPLDSATTSAYGWRNDPFRGRRKFHSGVDLRAAYGTEVPTAAPGKVTFAGERGGYGLLVVVEHANGVETRYAHLSSTAVKPGDSVASGQTIGRVGSTGRSTGPHLHFEVLLDGKRVNPEQIASARGDASSLPQAGQTLAP
jgi:murein DD-endopeptidase MepM/ murein hydrolase activator NlpD